MRRRHLELSSRPGISDLHRSAPQGAISAKASYTPNGGDSPFSFTLVATPIYPTSKLLIPPGAVPPGVVLQGITRAPATLENVETGARVAYAGSGWDVALIGFRGFNHLP